MQLNTALFGEERAMEGMEQLHDAVACTRRPDQMNSDVAQVLLPRLICRWRARSSVGAVREDSALMHDKSSCM